MAPLVCRGAGLSRMRSWLSLSGLKGTRLLGGVIEAVVPPVAGLGDSETGEEVPSVGLVGASEGKVRSLR